MAKKSPTLKSVESLRHQEAKRRNIPTAEYQSVIQSDAMCDAIHAQGHWVVGQ